MDTRSFLLGFVVGIWTLVLIVMLTEEKEYRYKAEIMESNTIIYIKDSLNSYEVGEQVWVNLDTKYVDNSDTTAMKCLIIKPM